LCCDRCGGWKPNRRALSKHICVAEEPDFSSKQAKKAWNYIPSYTTAGWSALQLLKFRLRPLLCVLEETELDVLARFDMEDCDDSDSDVAAALMEDDSNEEEELLHMIDIPASLQSTSLYCAIVGLAQAFVQTVSLGKPNHPAPSTDEETERDTKRQHRNE
jgi:hypothetical protein